MRAPTAFRALAHRTLHRALRDTRGATAVEYALIIAMIVLVMIVGLTAMAKPTIEIWNGISANVANAH